jgi:hypothetical protein
MNHRGSDQLTRIVRELDRVQQQLEHLRAEVTAIINVQSETFSDLERQARELGKQRAA